MPDPQLRRRARIAAKVTVAALALLLTGCSGPSATAWAGQVCDALRPWRANINQLNQQAQQVVGQATTPAQTRQALLALFASAAQATERARAAVADAGTPDVSGGAEVAREFVDSLAGTRDAYRHATAALTDLAPTDAGFYDRVVAIMQTLNDEYAASAVQTGSLDSPELKAAFDGVPQCG